jgi:hypothetical protein
MRIFEQDLKNQKAYILCKLIDIYTELEPEGGCLHIILSDENYDSDCTEFCNEENDYLGELIMSLLKEFTTDEIEFIINEGSWKIITNIEFGEEPSWEKETEDNTKEKDIIIEDDKEIKKLNDTFDAFLREIDDDF